MNGCKICLNIFFINFATVQAVTAVWGNVWKNEMVFKGLNVSFKGQMAVKVY
jgi:hypothetical protein